MSDTYESYKQGDFYKKVFPYSSSSVTQSEKTSSVIDYCSNGLSGYIQVDAGMFFYHTDMN